MEKSLGKKQEKETKQEIEVQTNKQRIRIAAISDDSNVLQIIRSPTVELKLNPFTIYYHQFDDKPPKEYSNAKDFWLVFIPLLNQAKKRNLKGLITEDPTIQEESARKRIFVDKGVDFPKSRRYESIYYYNQNLGLEQTILNDPVEKKRDKKKRKRDNDVKKELPKKNQITESLEGYITMFSECMQTVDDELYVDDLKITFLKKIDDYVALLRNDSVNKLNEIINQWKDKKKKKMELLSELQEKWSEDIEKTAIPARSCCACFTKEYFVQLVNLKCKHPLCFACKDKWRVIDERDHKEIINCPMCRENTEMNYTKRTTTNTNTFASVSHQSEQNNVFSNILLRAMFS